MGVEGARARWGGSRPAPCGLPARSQPSRACLPPPPLSHPPLAPPRRLTPFPPLFPLTPAALLHWQDYETKHYLPWLINSTFNDVHVTLAETLAQLSVEAGATTFVHLSALAADPNALSAWSRSKAAGEAAVRAVCPGATIVRPADVVGPEDRFLNLFAKMNAALPRIPLVNGGGARVQPLFVHDLAHAIHRIAVSEDPHVMLAQTYDLAGPDEYTLREIVEYVLESVRAESLEVADVTPAVADAIGRVIGVLPYPLIERDRFLRFQVRARAAAAAAADGAARPAPGNEPPPAPHAHHTTLFHTRVPATLSQADVVLDETAPTLRLHDLGIEATSMEMPGFNFLHRYRSGSHFVEMSGDKDK